MTAAGITVDTTAVEAMFDRLGDRTRNASRVAEDVARSAEVIGVPHDTGQLAGSMQVRATEDGAEIFTNVPYARHVFEGTRYVSARPPEVRAPDFADQVAQEVFG